MKDFLKTYATPAQRRLLRVIAAERFETMGKMAERMFADFRASGRHDFVSPENVRGSALKRFNFWLDVGEIERVRASAGKFGVSVSSYTYTAVIWWLGRQGKAV